MNDVEKTKEIYEKAFSEYGDDTRSVLWDRPMVMRYSELAKMANLNNRSVLDIGSGIGGFYEYLRDTCGYHDMQYQGVDIVEGMVELAAKKYPEAKFRCMDLFTEKLESTYEYVFLCGVFNNAIQTSEEYMKKMLKEAFSYCEKGMAFNFISSYVNFRDEEMAYHNPVDILSFCIENLSPKVEMHHHYAKCDVSVFVYR